MLTREHLGEKGWLAVSIMSALRKDRRIESCWQLSRASGECCLHQDSTHGGLGLARSYNTELRLEAGVQRPAVGDGQSQGSCCWHLD